MINKIGIIGAMDEEVDILKRASNIFNKTSIAGMEFCEGRLDKIDVIIVKCGMGKVNAGICANTLINNFDCNKIINIGVAGSLDNMLNIGDIVISTDACQHDFTVEAIGFKKGEIPFTGLYAFPADLDLRKLALNSFNKINLNVKAYEGRICSGDQFISTKEQKDKIVSNFGGLACEMEGAAVAQACYLNNIPFVIIRAISDKSDGSQSVEFETFKASAAKNCVKIVQEMLGRL